MPTTSRRGLLHQPDCPGGQALRRPRCHGGQRRAVQAPLLSPGCTPPSHGLPSSLWSARSLHTQPKTALPGEWGGRCPHIPGVTCLARGTGRPRGRPLLPVRLSQQGPRTETTGPGPVSNLAFKGPSGLCFLQAQTYPFPRWTPDQQLLPREPGRGQPRPHPTVKSQRESRGCLACPSPPHPGPVSSPSRPRLHEN